MSFDYLATSLSTILNLSSETIAGRSAPTHAFISADDRRHRPTGRLLISPSSIADLLRKADRAAYPAESILVGRT